MNRSKRTIAVAVVLAVMLLVAALSPAAADGPDRTDFEARGYICELGPAAREWYTDDGAVWHFRNMVFQSPVFSDDARVAGMMDWHGSQDLNQLTGDGRGWGTGILETAEGTWHTVYTTLYSAGVLSSQVTGHGINGLQGHSIYWEGAWLFPPYPDPSPCGAVAPMMALQVNGYILDHSGN